MSTTDRVAILLRQLKNNPELQDAVSNTAKLTTREVLVEPLFAGIDHGVPVPLLSADPVLTFEPLLTGLEFDDRIFYKFNEFISSNDSFLDLSHLLGKRDVLDINTRRLQKFVAKESLREFLKVIDVPSFLQNRAKEDEINISDFETLIEGKKFEETTKATDFIERLLLDLSKKEVLKLFSKIDEKTIKIKTSDVERLSVFDSVLAPKGRVAADRIGIIVSQPGFKKIPKFNNKISVENFLEELFPTKSVLSTVRARNLSIQAKARVAIEKLNARSKTQLQVNKNFEVSIDTESKITNKKVTTEKTSLVHSRSEEIIAKARLFVESVKTLSKLRLKTNKLAEEVIKTKIKTSFFVNNALLEKFTIRDAIINPAKVRLEIEKLGTLSKEAKQIEKPIRELADLISRVVLDPTKLTEDEITLLTAILTPKAKYAKDSVSITELITIGVPFRIQEVFDVNAVRLAKFLSMQIVHPEKVDTRDQVIASKALEIQKSSLGVKSSDRDSSGIGDVSFLFSTRILEFALLVARIVNIHVEKPLHSKISIRDSFVAPLSQVVSSRTSINDIKFGSLVGKNVVNLLVNLEDLFLIKDIKKQPILEKLTLKSFILNPAFAEHITERFLANDTFNPYLLRKSNDFKVDVRDRILKRFQEKNDGIQDTVSTSIKGHAFIRDTDYVKGAYFLQPYVATIPPGNSRQF